MLEPGQFRLGGLAALFLELHLPLVHPHHVAQTHREQDHQDLGEKAGDDLSHEEGPDIPPADLLDHFLRHRHHSVRNEGIHMIARQQQDVKDVEPLHLPLSAVQESRDQEVVVQPVQDEQRQDHPGAVTEHEQRLLHMAGRRPGDKGRNEKNTDPDDDLGGVQDEISSF